MRRRRREKAAADALYRATSRQQDPSKGTAAEQVAAAERALGSKQAVAQRLGVSVRSVQRWAAGEGKPRFRNASKLRDFTRNAPEVRRQQVSRLREARIRNHGARVRASGNIGVSAAGKKYKRRREIEAELSPEAMGTVMDAWLAGDDQGAMDALTEALGEEYVSGFDLGDALEDLDFLR